MSHEGGNLAFLIACLWSVCTEARTLFDVGLISYINYLDDGGSSHIHFLYPTLSVGYSHIATNLNMEYIFSENSNSGLDLTVEAIPNAPMAPGQYPVVAYLHGTGGFSLDSHTLLTQLVAMGFIVITSDMPGYHIGDVVYASALQRHMGEILVEIFNNCPFNAEELCEAMDFDHLTVLGPGVVDPMCTLDGWTKMGLRPIVQVLLEGNVEADIKCHPVEFDTQDAGFMALGRRDQEHVLNNDVNRLIEWTNQDNGMTAYILGFPKVPSVVAFTDLCDISLKLGGLMHHSETGGCSDIKQNDIEDVKAVTRGVVSNVLFHHFWNHPIDPPVETFEPDDYPPYVYRVIEQGLITDAVGILNTVPEKLPIIVEKPADSAYHFRTPTVLAILPMLLIAFIYVACGLGLCLRDYYIARRSQERGTLSKAECLAGILSRCCSLMKAPTFSFNPIAKSRFLRVFASKQGAASPEPTSTLNLLTVKDFSVSPNQVSPPNYRPPKRTTAIESISSPMRKNVSFEPLLQSTNNRKQEKNKRKVRSHSRKRVSQEQYEPLGSESDTEEY